MKIAEKFMMVKKQKSAPPATEKEKPPSEPEAAPQEAESAAVVPEAVSPIQIPPKVLEQARALGVDLGQIVNWAQSVEQRLNIVLNALPEMPAQTIKLLKEEAEKQRAAAVAQMQQNPQAQGGNPLAFIGQILPAIMGGGGGDSELAELGKKALMSQISMSTAITNAVVAKITGKATSDVAEAVTGG